MAGAFTHMAVAAKAKNPFKAGTQYGEILRKHLEFVTMGSVSPDIPYLGQLAFQDSTWADLMHYQQTNGIVQRAIVELSAQQIRDESWECKLAWLSGFIAHLVTDATIHPIVESTVGPYSDKNSRPNHQQCEMTQDVLIFKDVMNIEVDAGEYTDYLKTCRDSNYFAAVADFWRKHGSANYPQAKSLEVESIFESYFNILDTADGSDDLAKAFRHLGSGLIYDSSQDLRNNSAQLVERYYNNVKFPDGSSGLFQQGGFDKAVKNLRTVWSSVESILFSGGAIVEIVPNWNLDTGVDQSTGLKTYWS